MPFADALLPNSIAQDVQKRCSAGIPSNVVKARKVFEIVRLYRVHDIRHRLKRLVEFLFVRGLKWDRARTGRRREIMVREPAIPPIASELSLCRYDGQQIGQRLLDRHRSPDRVGSGATAPG